MDHADGNVEVVLANGRVMGRRDGAVIRFAGVPYAEAPVGERRFQPPVPASPWAGLLDCTNPSVIAPQLASRLIGVMGDFQRVQSEDCLRLTITAPDASGSGRPVIVWLHGGGFSSGSGGLDWYDGSRLAAEGDIVVVGVNYRLGALGFLAAEGVSRGNLGLLDQALALRFVRDNIAAFGGDPGNITLMGQSAGGNSIAALFAGDHVPDGVRRAIFQSAAFGMSPVPAAAAQDTGRRFLAALGVSGDGAAARAAATAAPVKTILEGQGAVARGGARYGDTAPPFQLIQGSGLPERSDFHIAAVDRMAGVEVLLGTTLHEAHAFLAAHPHTAELHHPDAVQTARAVYGAGGSAAYEGLWQRFPEASAGALFSRLVADEIFVRPSAEFAERLLARKNKVFLYDFAWQPPSSPFGSCHCLELPFVFGPSSAWLGAPMLAGGDPDAIDRLSEAVRAAWIAFVRTGNPSVAALPVWSAAQPGRLTSMRLDEAPRLQAYGAFEASEL